VTCKIVFSILQPLLEPKDWWDEAAYDLELSQAQESSILNKVSVNGFVYSQSQNLSSVLSFIRLYFD
jgi:hypothetical protein